MALLKTRADFYGTRKATPADVVLLVEISDTTLRTDLGRKAPIYADAGVGEYWVIAMRAHRASTDITAPRFPRYPQTGVLLHIPRCWHHQLAESLSRNFAKR